MTDIDQFPLTTITPEFDGATLSLSVLEPLVPMAEGVARELAVRRAEWTDGFSEWMGWAP